MTRLEKMRAQIKAQQQPTSQHWQPHHCGDIDITILPNGDWLHEGARIQRLALIKLFASVLTRESDDYFLLTPVEKVRIHVANTPFVVTSAECIDGHWFMTNNLGELAELNAEMPLDLEDSQNPRLLWRRNLPARISQSVMYQWQTFAIDRNPKPQGRLWLTSGESRFLLGEV